MRRIESISIPGYNGGRYDRDKESHFNNHTDEVIDPTVFNLINDFLKSVGLKLVSLYRLGPCTGVLQYSVAAVSSDTLPVLLITVNVDDGCVNVDSLNNHTPSITNIRQKIQHQQFFHIYNGNGAIALVPMYTDNPIRSLKHHVFEVPTQLKEFLNVKT